MTVVLITGASSGIGRATAKLLACSGYRVFGTSRNPERATPLPGVTFLAMDLNDIDSIQACVERVLEQAGRIDVLVNNAGLIGPGTASEEADLETVRRLFETNFFGVVQMTNAVLPVMRAQRCGTIINISSAGGQVAAPPFFTFYAASKHALEAYSEGLRYEVRPFHIRVVVIEPGYTRTGILNTIQPPDHPIPDYEDARRRVVLLDRFGIRNGSPPEEVARQVLDILDNRPARLRFPVGSDTHWITALHRWLPYTMFERLIEWMYLVWKPARGDDRIPEPGELGLYRYLFDRPARDQTLRTVSLAAISLVSVVITLGLLHRRK